MTDLKTKKLLIIVESPNKCSTISNILKKAGYENATVVASLGHIMELGDGGSYRNSGIEPEKDFDLNLKISQDKHDTVKKLKAQARVADLVYLMSDQDREGELISWSLIKFLDLPLSSYRRAVTHEITPKAIVTAIENPTELSESMVNAALARLTIDKMIGYSLSPIAKAYVGARSVGRCQSAGLKLVVDREREIQNFEPEYYYDLFLQFNRNGNTYKAKYIGTADKKVDKITTTSQLNDIKCECTGSYIITDIIHTIKSESPKPPFCTATFQQEAASKLGLKVKDAMSCAQKLFEGIKVDGEHVGLITYMRTDATDISKEFLPELKSFVEFYIGKGKYRKPKVVKSTKSAQEGHEALRIVDPTKFPELVEAHLKNDLLTKVYKLIWQRTIAAAMPDAKISETAYIIENNGHRFKLVSNELLDPGYRSVYNLTVYDSSEPELTKAPEIFAEGELIEAASLIDLPKQTQPPARYKEATLIKELQKREIGRPSTYVTIVETVLNPTRGYCVLENKELVPTDRGIQLSDFLDRSFSNVINLEYTKQLEESLDAIANKKLDKLDFLKDFYRALENSIAANQETAGKSINSSEKTCPNCSASMVVRRSRYGKLFYGCSQYPKCRGIVGIE